MDCDLLTVVGVEHTRDLELRDIPESGVIGIVSRQPRTWADYYHYYRHERGFEAGQAADLARAEVTR